MIIFFSHARFALRGLEDGSKLTVFASAPELSESGVQSPESFAGYDAPNPVRRPGNAR